MATYTRKEFAIACGITSNPNQVISSNIKRGKIVLNKDGLIDDTVRENADFKKLYEGIAASKAEETAVEKHNSNTIIPAAEKVATSKKVQKAAEQATISKYSLELEKTQADIDKKYIDTELAKIKLQVLMGGNIPISQVKSIISTLSKSILTNYKSQQDQFITEICHEHGIPNEERTKLLSRGVTGLNSIHSKAVMESRIQLKNAIGSTQTRLAIEDDEE